MTEERIVVDVPDWVSVQEATAVPGETYWRLTKIRYLDEHHSNGLHHIFSMEPHDAGIELVVSNGHQTWHVPHDKPASEPAANFAMWAKNTYTVWVVGRNATTSDRAGGFHMPFNLHVAYQLWWELTEKQLPAEEPASDEDLPAALLNAAAANQVIQFNPDAALQKAIFADGFVPNSAEFEVRVAGTTYVAQRAEHLSTGEIRVYYVAEGDWTTVRHIVRADHGADTDEET